MTEEKTYITLKFDLMFKRIFGDPNDLGPIRRFLKEVLDISPKKITILNPERIDKPYKEKKTNVDLIVELEDNTKVNIEINTTVGQDIINRNLYYMCKNISKDGKDIYDYKYNKHIQINLDYTGEHKEPIMRYTLYDKEAKSELTDMMQIIRIDIPYFYKMCYHRDVKDLDMKTKFLGLFGVKDRDEAMKLCDGDNDMENIYNKLEEYNDDDDVMGAYDWKERIKQETRISVEEDYKDKLESARNDGAHNKAIETAKKMLKKGIDIDIISEFTELDKKVIEELSKDL